MTEAVHAPQRSAWVRNLARPTRAFIGTEVGSAIVLLGAVLLAVAWANSPWDRTYEDVWSTELSIHLGGAEVSEDLRGWVNDGLMALFFFVIGLEIRRELDMGELRDRRRVAVPVIAALGGMLVPALIYVTFNAGTDAAHGWGIVMATDTAFALGVPSSCTSYPVFAGMTFQFTSVRDSGPRSLPRRAIRVGGARASVGRATYRSGLRTAWALSGVLARSDRCA